MLTFRRFCQHKLNPLHMYCRLRAVGVHTGLAQKVCLVYERYLYKAFLG